MAERIYPQMGSDVFTERAADERPWRRLQSGISSKILGREISNIDLARVAGKRICTAICFWISGLFNSQPSFAKYGKNRSDWRL